MDDNKKKKNGGKRGGPVEPPPPHVSRQGTNLLSSLIQFFFPSSSFFPNPPPSSSSSPSPPSPPLTSSAVNAGKYFVCLSAECKMYDGVRKSGGLRGAGSAASGRLGSLALALSAKASCSVDALCHAFSGEAKAEPGRRRRKILLPGKL